MKMIIISYTRICQSPKVKTNHNLKEYNLQKLSTDWKVMIDVDRALEVLYLTLYRRFDTAKNILCGSKVLLNSSSKVLILG